MSGRRDGNGHSHQANQMIWHNLVGPSALLDVWENPRVA